jgi:putative ABC transport system ATP-binding protein
VESSNPPAADEVIVTRGVTKEYSENGMPVLALHGIDLAIERGEFTAIVGPSGSGKTTLLNVVSGLDTVTSGEVWLAGQKLSAMSGRQLSDFRRDHIGFIFQAYNLVPVLSAAENAEYIMLLQGVPKAERRARVDAMLSLLGLEGLADRRPTQLSGGQQQRAAIARAMVSRPDLILADEPTANLDSATAIDLIEMMRTLNQETGMTFVFSTHDQKIMDRAQRVVVLVDGQIAEDDRRSA